MVRFHRLSEAVDRQRLHELIARVRRATSSAARQLGGAAGATEGGGAVAAYQACGLDAVAHDLYVQRVDAECPAPAYVSHSEADDDAIVLRPLAWINTTCRADALRAILEINGHLPCGGLALAKHDDKELVVFVDHLVASSLDESELRASLVAAHAAGARCGVDERRDNSWYERTVSAGIAERIEQSLLARGTGWASVGEPADGVRQWVRGVGAPVVASYDEAVGVLLIAREIRGFVGRPPLESAERYTVANLTLLDCTVASFQSGERGMLALVGRLCCDDLDGPELDRVIVSFEQIPSSGAGHLRPANDVLSLIGAHCHRRSISPSTQAASSEVEWQDDLRLGRHGDDDALAIPVTDLLTHAFVCGASGSGKTVVCKNLIEEAALAGVPSIVVDLKGDLSSLACVPSGVDRDSILEYLVKMYGESAGISSDAIEKHTGQMEAGYRDHGINDESLAAFHARVRYRILTPRADFGVPISLSPLQGLDLDAVDTTSGIIGNRDLHETLESTLASLVEHIRLPDGDTETLVSVLIQLIESAHRSGRPLSGIEGISTLVEMLFDVYEHARHVNFLPTDYAIGEKQAQKYARAMNARLGGTFRYWFDGHELSVDDLINIDDGRVPINIVNLSALQSQSDQMYAIAQLNARIVSWMRRQPGAQRPRLIYYIDEIAQSGGSGAIFPPHPYNPITKPGLTTLLKQGRAFGVSCLLATQNAKDIDYKGLGQCDTWVVGKIKTDADIERLKLGLEAAQLDASAGGGLQLEDVVQEVAALNTGQFVVRTRSQGVIKYKQQWIRSFHERLSPEMLRNWLRAVEIPVEKKLAKANELWNDRQATSAIELLQEIVSNEPYFSRLAQAKLLLCEWLFRTKQWQRLVDDAADLRKSVNARRGFERVHYYEGMSLFECGRFDDARGALRRFVQEASSSDRDLAEQCDGMLQEVLIKQDDYEQLEDDVREQESSGRLSSAIVSRIASFCKVMRKALRVWPALRGGLDGACVIAEASRDRVRYTNKTEKEVKEYLVKIHARLGELPPYQIPSAWTDEECAAMQQVHARMDLAEQERVERRREITAFLTEAEQLARGGELGRASERIDLARKAVVATGLCRTDYERVLSVYRGYANHQRDSLRDWLQNMDPIDFELETASLLRGLGYEAQATKASGDGGVDVFAQFENRRIVVQCKRYRHSISPNLIREFATVIRNFDADEGLFVTTSTFTDGCREEAKLHGIRLVDLDGLIQLYRSRSERADEDSGSDERAATPSADTVERIVLEMLARAEHPLAAKEIADSANLELSDCQRVIKPLVDAGRLEKHGRARGTRYSLAKGAASGTPERVGFATRPRSPHAHSPVRW